MSDSEAVKEIVIFESKDRRCCREYKWSNHRLNYFIENTTINGLVYVFKSDSKIRRIIWGIIFCCALISCTTVIGYSVKKFIDEPTATTTFVGFNYSIPFPAVSVCNLNTYSNSSETEMDRAHFSYIIFNPNRKYNLHSSEDYNCSNHADDYAGIWEYMSSSAFQKDFIVYCGFSQGPGTEFISCEEEIQPTLTTAGVCYTFNSFTNGQPDKFLTNTGVRHGLKMILSVDDEHSPPDGTSGIKVVIHDRNDIPRPSIYGIGVPTERSAFIGIKILSYIDETDVSDCINGFPLSFLPGIVYSQSACRENILLEQTAQVCGCALYRGHPELRNCSFNDSCCLLQLTSFDFDDCKLPCAYTVYESKRSYAAFPTGQYGREIMKNANSQRNFVSFHVFMEDLRMTYQTTYYTYNFQDFLADIGGQLGLFLGISLISIMEVLILVLDELKAFCCRGKIKRTIKEIDKHIILPEIVD